MYQEGLANVEEISLPQHGFDTADEGDNGFEHAWHLYMIRLISRKLTITRDEFIEILKKRKIGTSVHFIPLHMQPFYRDTHGYRPEDFPNAKAAYEGIVSLPIYPKMSDKDVNYVISMIKQTIQAHRRHPAFPYHTQEETEVSL